MLYLIRWWGMHDFGTSNLAVKLKLVSQYSVWPDLVIYWTLGNFLKPLATINLPESPTFYGNFCKGVKIYQFSSEIIFWATFIDICQFFLVALTVLGSRSDRLNRRNFNKKTEWLFSPSKYGIFKIYSAST